jgi:ferredoxin
MIFYFSGTGNSLYAAQKLHEAGEGEIIDMAGALNEKHFKYKLSAGEKVGIVFPVYFYGLPTIVDEFMDKLTIESDGSPFIYTVITCGGSIGHADKMIADKLKQKNLQLNSAFSIKMPSNYVIMYDTPDKEKQDLTLREAEKQIEKIVGFLEVNKKGNFVSNRGYFALLSPVAYKLYGTYRKTKKFYVTDACTSCGLCEEICPSGTIQRSSGKPEWVTEKCSHCSACINRCPARAIQYGDATKKRGRYVNPNVEFSN